MKRYLRSAYRVMGSDHAMHKPSIFPHFLLLISVLFLAVPTMAQSAGCTFKFSASSYEIDEQSGISEYAGTIKPQDCENGCSGELMLEFQYALTTQKTEKTLKPDTGRKVGDYPFNERMVSESKTLSATEPRTVSWRSKAGEEVEVEGHSTATSTLCRSSMGGICRPLKLKASSYQRCQRN